MRFLSKKIVHILKTSEFFQKFFLCSKNRYFWNLIKNLCKIIFRNKILPKGCTST